MTHITHFTSDWFSKYVDNWIRHLGHLKYKETHALEIGSYEGRSTCWMLDNILTHSKSDIICVDTWDGLDKTLGQQTVTAKGLFDNNTKIYGDKVCAIWESSKEVLPKMLNVYTFSLIFIDGDHEGYSALTDLILSWPLLNNGGHLVFDDYQWSHNALRSQPKDAWDAFVSVKPLGLKWELDGRQVFARKEL